MHRGVRLALGVLVVLAGGVGQAHAQYGYNYPGGYGMYGWSRWGADPASGYMAGLGSYARGQGVYELLDAKAQAINTDTMVKWNKALRQQQRIVRREQQEAAARDAANQAARNRQEAVESGLTLNVLLDRMIEFNPSGTRAYSAKTPLSPEVIRDIPFQAETEAITICLDQMTADDGWPSTLQDDRFADDRAAIRKAARQALEEDAKGDVSPDSVKQINAAVAKLRAKYTKTNGEFDLLYADADDFVKSLSGLSGMLTNPSLKPILAQLESYRGGTIGDLIAFMHAFNLRFGPATSPRQLDIYKTLAPILSQVLADTGG
jgi:hypothetical protein